MTSPVRLTSLTLRNFKAIGDEPQTITFAPITLLFGPNSAGKSTVLQALHYAREILERQNVDPDLTLTGGRLDLGGFLSLVHQHDLRRAITIRIEASNEFEHTLDEMPLNGGGYLGEDGFKELRIRYLVGELYDDGGPSARVRDYGIVQDLGIELDIRWSNQRAAPFVSRFAVDLDGEPVAQITSPPETGRAILSDFHFAHPLLTPVDEWEDELAASEHSQPSPLQELLQLLSIEVAAYESNPAIPDEDKKKVRVGVATPIGALPPLDQDLRLELRDPEPTKFEKEFSTPRLRALQRLVSEMMLGPARLVCRLLEQITYIGPLRDIPPRGYRPQVSPDVSRWAQGLAAWDLLHSEQENKLIDAASTWLADKDRLNAGYQLERREYREVSVPGAFAAMFQRGLREEDIPDLQELFAELPARREIILRELQTGVEVVPSDVGVGLSQLIPIVVVSLAEDQEFVAIEQPELHLHPALQVAIGDLFVSSAVAQAPPPASQSLKTFLIETHSEHLILRLLRRIRETAQGELPPGAPALKPDDIAVCYVEPAADGVRIQRLRANDKGDFVDRWPRGFFEERGDELFS